MIIVSVTGAPFPDAAWLAQALQRDFADVVFAPVEHSAASTLRAGFGTRLGEANVSLLVGDDQLVVEGNTDVEFEVAAWFRGLLTSDFPPVVAVDADWTGHVTLTAGITADEAARRWRDEPDASWTESDPAFG